MTICIILHYIIIEDKYGLKYALIQNVVKALTSKTLMMINEKLRLKNIFY